MSSFCEDILYIHLFQAPLAFVSPLQSLREVQRELFIFLAFWSVLDQAKFETSKTTDIYNEQLAGAVLLFLSSSSSHVQHANLYSMYTRMNLYHVLGSQSAHMIFLTKCHRSTQFFLIKMFKAQLCDACIRVKQIVGSKLWRAKTVCEPFALRIPISCESLRVV